MELQIVSLEIAKIAKELGFDWPCTHRWREPETISPKPFIQGGGYTIKSINTKTYFHDTDKIIHTLAPEQHLLQKWIRENSDYMISIYNNASGYLWDISKVNGGTHITWSEYRGTNESGCWDKYEDALENALIYALNKIKENKNGVTNNIT